MILTLFLTTNVFADDNTFQLTEAQKQQITADVDGIYKAEGGKRSKAVIIKELSATGMIIASNDMAIEAMKAKNLNEAEMYANIGINQLKTTQAEIPKNKLNIPQLATTYAILGDISRKRNDPKKAIVNYEKATRINPKLAVAYFNLGILYSATGDKKTGIANFNKAFALDKNFIEVAQKILNSP